MFSRSTLEIPPSNSKLKKPPGAILVEISQEFETLSITVGLREDYECLARSSQSVATPRISPGDCRITSRAH